MYIPAARPMPPLDWTGIPRNLRDNYRDRVSAVCRSKQECADLVHWFGDADFCPFMPVLIYVSGSPQMIDGMGLAPAAELRDMAVAIWDIITERLAKTGRTFDFDSAREKAGLMRKEDVDAAMREAFRDRVRRHKANPITDPPRQPHYVRVAGKTLHTVADPKGWR